MHKGTREMDMMRRVVLGVADVPLVERFFHGNRLAKSLVDRFIAGDSVEEALAVAKELAALGITVTLDQLGENVKTREEASAAVATYVDTLKRMKDAAIEPNISVKLTMLGLDFGDDAAETNMRPILETAREVGGFVRVDMEGSDYTQRTLDIFYRLFADFPDNVGIVIQTYLHRSAGDVVDAIEKKTRVRLVKGAYAEPESVAIQGADARDRNYDTLMKHLLDKGNYPAIATHDPALIDAAISYTRQNGIPADRFEFQMLYGVRRSEQERLRKAGYNMRVYIPFGTEWYPYFTRRIAERPANAFFVARQLIDR
ncbi:MAG TPA: proline dehydrogenase family protein [Thermomicrobiales bacterium]|nr:proline dehydrogenase family protein [Thermomicrobiales bacterium]